MLEFLTSAGFGSIIGLVGSFLTKREARKSKAQDYAHAEAMADRAMEELKLEGQLHIDAIQAEGEIQTEMAETNAFAESLKQGNKNTGIGFVDAIRGLMRPTITIYMLIIATYFTIKVSDLLGGLEVLEQAELLALYKQILKDMLFLTVTAVTWWFGSRPERK